jgi:hypothetical protein
MRAKGGSGSIRNGYRCLPGYNAQYEHTAIAERVLGRPLLAGEVVHHMDGNRLNNSNDNLAIFPNEDYHKLIHKRMRAMAATGNPDALVCRRCGKYDDPINLKVLSNGGRKTPAIYHPECERNYGRSRYVSTRS